MAGADSPQSVPHDDGRDNPVVERLVASCLVDAERFAAGELAALCTAHPSEAATLRRQFGALRAAGLLGLPPQTPRLTDSAATWDTDARDVVTDPEAAKRYPAVGPYQPLKELGRGGQAVVYLAEDLRLHRPVALKVLTGMGPLSETLIRRFRREAEVASRLDHPGICAVFDAGVKGDVPYIAMRYVAGVTLADRVDACRPDPKKGMGNATRRAADVGSEESQVTLSVGSHVRREIHRVLEVIEKTARALHAAHEAGVVHRDVKPGNIMVTPDGEPVLLDFGLAGDAEQGLQTLTETGEMVGTPAYMSPEQLMARRIRLDRRTDVYSLGATLFECLTLRRPYAARTRERMYEAIQYKDPLDVLKLNSRLPADVKVVLETALEKDRDRRYQTADELADDLRRVRLGEPIAARPVGAAGRVWRWAKRRPGRAVLLLVLILGIPLVAGLGGHIAANLPRIREAAAQARREHVEERLGRGYLELAESNHEDALARFDEVLSLEPGNPEAITGRALVLAQQHDHRGLLDYLDAYRDLEPELPVLTRIRVTALRGLGRVGEADDIERRGIPEPKTPLGHVLECRMLLQWVDHHGLFGGTVARDRMSRAVDHAGRAVFGARSPRPFSLFTLVKSLVTRSEHAERYAAGMWPTRNWTVEPHDAAMRQGAVAAVRERWPESPETWLHVARGTYDDDPEAALAACARTLELDPENSGAYSWRARVLNQKRKDYAGAEAAARRAVELWPKNAFHRIQLGMAHFGLKHEEECLARLREAVELAPEPAEAYATLASTLWWYRRLGEALVASSKAVESSPEVPGYAYCYAVYLLNLGRNREAVRLLRTVLEREPGDPEAHIELSYDLVLLGRFKEARAAAERAVRLRPEDGLAHRECASACWNGGDFRAALASLKRANRFGIDALRASRRGMSLGQLQQDLDMMRTWVELEPKLREVIADRATAADSSEASHLAWMTYHRAYPVHAMRLFAKSFEDAENREGWVARKWAARAAALAAAGRGHDAESLDEAARARAARQAVAWLEDDLAAERRRHREGAIPASYLVGILNRWRAVPAFAGIRDPDALERLPAEERRALRAFWAGVDRLIEQLMKRDPAVDVPPPDRQDG